MKSRVVVATVVLLAGVGFVPAGLVPFSGSQCARLSSSDYIVAGSSPFALSSNGSLVLASSGKLNGSTGLALFTPESNTPVWQTFNTSTQFYWARVTMSADGSFFSVGGYGSEWVGLWGRDSTAPHWTFPGHLLQTYPPGEPPDPSTSVAISGNGRYVAIRTIEPGISDSLYLLRTGSNIPLWHYQFQDAASDELVLSISYEGASIATVKQGMLYVFSQYDNQTVMTARVSDPDNSDFVKLQMSSAGDRIFVAENSTAAIYSPTNDLPVRTFDFGPAKIIDFAVSSDGTTLGVVSQLSTGTTTSTQPPLSVLDTSSGRRLFTTDPEFQPPDVGYPFPNGGHVAVSQDGARILMARNYGIAIFDRYGSQVCQSLQSNVGFGAGISQDGKVVASGQVVVSSTSPGNRTLLSLPIALIGAGVAVAVSGLIVYSARRQPASSPAKDYLGRSDIWIGANWIPLVERPNST